MSLWGKQGSIGLFRPSEPKRSPRAKWLKAHSYAKKQKSGKNRCKVYILREAPGMPIRYVGQTRQTLSKRLHCHMKELRKRQERGWWLSKAQKWLASLPAAPVIELIDGKGIWDISEAVWIDRLRTRGEPLLNVLSVVGSSPWTASQ